MPFIEAPTNFYIGRRYDPETQRLADEVIYYDSRDLTTHAVVVGMTGSGKTGMCIALLEEAVLDGVPAIVIDPKGDITNLLLNFPQLRPEDFAPWVNPSDARYAGLSVQEYAAEVAQQWREGLASWGITSERMAVAKNAAQYSIYTPGSDAGLPVSILASLQAPRDGWAGNEEFHREQISGIVTALMALIGKQVEPVKDREHVLISNIFEEAWRRGEDLSLEDIILRVQNPPFSRLGVFDVNTFFPERDRFRLAKELNNIIAAPSFQTWISGEPLDMRRLLYTPDGRPRVAIFYLAHLTDNERTFIITLILENMLAWMRSLSGTTSLRAILYFDEIFGHIPPAPRNPPTKEPMLRLLKTARAFGIGLVLATQNPGDLDYKGLANAGTWLIGKLQTDNDKRRVLSGLQANATANSKLDVSTLDRLISGLAPRVFVLHNVHNEGGPVLVHSRWTMSYLRGPLTRQQVRLLMDEQRQGLVRPPMPTAQPSVLQPNAPAVPTSAVPPRLMPTEPPAVSNSVSLTSSLPSAAPPPKSASSTVQSMPNQPAAAPSGRSAAPPPTLPDERALASAPPPTLPDERALVSPPPTLPDERAIRTAPPTLPEEYLSSAPRLSTFRNTASSTITLTPPRFSVFDRLRQETARPAAPASQASVNPATLTRTPPRQTQTTAAAPPDREAFWQAPPSAPLPTPPVPSTNMPYSGETVPVSTSAVPQRSTSQTARARMLPSGYDTRPVSLPSGIAQYFLPIVISLDKAIKQWEVRNGVVESVRGDAQLLYRPVLFAQVAVRYLDRKSGAEAEQHWAFHVPDVQIAGFVRWSQHQAPYVDLDDLSSEPHSEAAYGAPSPGLTDAKRMRALRSEVIDFVARSAALVLPYNSVLDIYGKPGESHSEFVNRISQIARERRDAEIDAATARAEKLFADLEARLRRAEQRLQAEKSALDELRREDLYTTGEAVMSLLRGRTSYTLSRVSRARRFKKQSQERMSAAEQEIQQIEDQIEAEQQRLENTLQEINEKWRKIAQTVEEYRIKPFKKDVALEAFGIGWVPLWFVVLNNQPMTLLGFDGTLAGAPRLEDVP
ncbi:MAG: DUF87 domain-containing protein [Anaerolineae bacterium]|nr:DUF87 domain-containing protein [Anaerolineae bacterium]